MPTISFDDWKNEINAIVKKEVGYNLDELRDMQYRFWFDNFYIITRNRFAS